jgi:hypothetical protein
VNKFIDHLHYSELQIITALSLISTLYKSPQHLISLFPGCCVSKSRSLAMASNSRDASASCAQVLSSQPPMHNWILNRWPTTNYSTISSQPRLQNSTELVAPSLFFLTPHCDNTISPVSCITIAEGMCLPIHSLGSGCITPLFIHLLHINDCPGHSINLEFHLYYGLHGVMHSSTKISTTTTCRKN